MGCCQIDCVHAVLSAVCCVCKEGQVVRNKDGLRCLAHMAFFITHTWPSLHTQQTADQIACTQSIWQQAMEKHQPLFHVNAPICFWAVQILLSQHLKARMVLFHIRSMDRFSLEPAKVL